MENDSNQIQIVNLSEYTSPTIEENQNEDWIEYGMDNQYFQYIIDRFTGSTTNQAVINGISAMIYGKGLAAKDARLKTNEWAKVMSILGKKDLRRYIKDYKLLGMGALQIEYKSKKIVKIEHFPMETLRAEKADKNGNIAAWYYHPDWDDFSTIEPKRIPSFGTTDQKKTEIYVLKPYVNGYFYYSPVDYSGALPYAYLEGQIGDYQINDVDNGFSGTKLINFNNGDMTPEDRVKVKRGVIASLTGSKGERVIISFNDNQESQTTVEDLPLDNAPEHYQYLSSECENKIIVGHRITSPLLVGVRTENNGLGSNADEISNAYDLFYSTVIELYQDEIIDSLDEILAVNGITLDLYFKPSTPKFMNETAATELSLSEEVNPILKLFIDAAESDEDLSGYNMIDGYEVTGDDDLNFEVHLEAQEPTLLQKIVNLVSTGTARPKSPSEQDQANKDGDVFLTRYRYTEYRNPAPGNGSRSFCNAMMNANKLYRKEDIEAMGSKAVNPGLGPNGTDTYSIWKFHGGKNCLHSWRREIYMKKEDSNETTKISRTRATKLGYKIIKNPIEVATPTYEQPNHGGLK